MRFGSPLVRVLKVLHLQARAGPLEHAGAKPGLWTPPRLPRRPHATLLVGRVHFVGVDQDDGPGKPQGEQRHACGLPYGPASHYGHPADVDAGARVGEQDGALRSAVRHKVVHQVVDGRRVGFGVRPLEHLAGGEGARRHRAHSGRALILPRAGLPARDVRAPPRRADVDGVGRGAGGRPGAERQRQRRGAGAERAVVLYQGPHGRGKAERHARIARVADALEEPRQEVQGSAAGGQGVASILAAFRGMNVDAERRQRSAGSAAPAPPIPRARSISSFLCAAAPAAPILLVMPLSPPWALSQSTTRRRTRTPSTGSRRRRRRARSRGPRC